MVQLDVNPERSRPAEVPAPSAVVAGRSRSPRVAALFVVLGALLALGVVLNLALGAVAISPGTVLAVLGRRIGLGHATVGLGDDAVIWQIRLPRVTLGLLVGAALAISGAALQATFRNPLAEPTVVGVSSGAATGAVLAIVGGMSFLGTYTVPALAFLGAVIAVLVVYAAARGYGRTEVLTLVLTGIAVSMIGSALTGLFTYFASTEELRGIVFWTLGSVGGATWPVVGVVAPIIGFGLVALAGFGRVLNLLSLGDAEARHLGVSVDAVRLAVVVLCALVTGAGVAVAGIVGFVGLVVPHVVRLLIGPDLRVLLPASALGGAVLVIFADLIARTVATPKELPLGVITALIGGPFFLWLIARTRRLQNGLV